MATYSRPGLPSKKIFIFLGAVVLFFIIFFAYKPLMAKIKSGDFRSTLSYSAGLNAAAGGADADADGLMDFQETLWGTDPKNPDTDGDGTKDGEETATERDPLKAGPGDETFILPIFDNSSSGFIPFGDPNNLTAQAAAGIFSQYSLLQDDSGDVSASSQSEIVNNTVASLQTDTIQPKYTLKDLRTFDQNNKPKLKDFSNELVAIQNNTLGKLSDNASNAETISAYQNLIDSLAKLEVPSDMNSEYLSLLNNYYSMKELLKIMTASDSDPLKSLLALNSYRAVNTKNADIYTQFAIYLKKNGIIWNDNEAGAVWNQI